MKKILILIRHAQAAFNTVCDAERSLTPQGKHQAARTGQLLQQAQLTPELILSSPLLRAKQSAEQIATAWKMPVQTTCQLDGRLSARGLLEFALDYLNQYNCILLVGHNPNISLAAGLLNEQYVSFHPANAMAFDVTNLAKPQLIFQELS